MGVPLGRLLQLCQALVAICNEVSVRFPCSLGLSLPAQVVALIGRIVCGHLLDEQIIVFSTNIPVWAMTWGKTSLAVLVYLWQPRGLTSMFQLMDHASVAHTLCTYYRYPSRQSTRTHAKWLGRNIRLTVDDLFGDVVKAWRNQQNSRVRQRLSTGRANQNQSNLSIESPALPVLPWHTY